MNLVCNIQRSPSTFGNSNFALLSWWKVPNHMLELGMLNDLCCRQRRPVVLELAFR